jgi:adenylate kinase family enzyme
MSIVINCIIGPVGSGKTTLFNSFDPEVYVRYSSGTMCRNAVGTKMFTTGDAPNAPEVLDDFVFDGFRSHLYVADAIGRDMVCEFPRTKIQCERMIQELHRFGPASEIEVYVHQLMVCERTWESRLRLGRWKDRPDLEEMDRARYADSIKDAVESAAWFRAAGPPIAHVLIYAEHDEKKPKINQVMSKMKVGRK